VQLVRDLDLAPVNVLDAVRLAARADATRLAQLAAAWDLTLPLAALGLTLREMLGPACPFLPPAMTPDERPLVQARIRLGARLAAVRDPRRPEAWRILNYLARKTVSQYLLLTRPERAWRFQKEVLGDRLGDRLDGVKLAGKTPMC